MLQRVSIRVITKVPFGFNIGIASSELATLSPYSLARKETYYNVKEKRFF